MSSEYTVSLKHLPRNPVPSVVSIGNFDGVHRGHQCLFSTQQQLAKKHQLQTQALVLFPHPAVVLGFEAPEMIMSIDDRLSLIKDLGIEHVFHLPFDVSLAQISARDFLHMMNVHMGMRILCIGENTHIGKDREGSPPILKELGKEMGIEVEVIPAMEVDHVACSSTLIRALLRRGEIHIVNSLLGHRFFTRGTIGKGMGNGQKLGFPTANFVNLETMIPGQGVYATFLMEDGKIVPCATNVGFRPTISKGGSLVVETHVLDRRVDWVGKEVQLFWHKRIRMEKKFANKEALSNQIQVDVVEIKKLFQSFKA
ncbi:MAG: riboflavin biosynthesis protein RibF [Bdellovibrionota bacterium]